MWGFMLQNMFNNASPLKILFIGMPDLALACLDEVVASGKTVVGIVPPPKTDPTFAVMTQLAQKHNIPLLAFEKNLKDSEFLEKIKQLKPDIGIVASYNTLLPKELYEIPKMGTINCHPSLLPDYRGGNPYFHVINNNEKITGITYHFIDETFDTGEIIHQVQMPISPTDTMGTLFNRLNFHSAKNYVELLTKIENNEKLTPKAQLKKGELKKASNILPEKGHNIIDWTKEAVAIERFIRALNPFYGGTTYFKGVMVRMWKGKYSNNINVSNLEPGTIVKKTDEMLLIATGNGVFMPEIMQFGTFFTSDIKDFIALTNPKVGEMFQS